MTTAPSSPGAPITDKRQLVEYLESGCKPPAAWRVGTEHEKFVFRRSDLRRAPYEGPDGIAALLKPEGVVGYEFSGTRYDCGSKLGYLEANVMYARKHSEIGAPFRAFLSALAGDD